MTSPQQRWDLRHREAASHPPPAAAAFLVESFPLLPRPHPRSRALDLACGAGQNAVWLAERGWPVVAVDFSPAALDRAAALAAVRGIPAERHVFRALPHRCEGICLVEADLETAALPHAAFDLILCFRYLDRHAFRRIERALIPGGFLLYETFVSSGTGTLACALESPAVSGVLPPGPDRPHGSDHLLVTGELRTAFPALESLFYREWSGMASLLARKP